MKYGADSTILPVTYGWRTAFLGFAFFSVFALPGTVSTAFAQEVQPGDACIAGESGWFKRTSMATQADGGNMLFCDGVNWQSFLTFTSAGNLGVWNSTPGVELDITGTGQMDALNFNGVTGIAAPLSGSGGAGLWTAGSGDDIYYNSGTPMVGIGMTDPTEALDVTGSIKLSGNLKLGSVSSVGTPLSTAPALGDLSNVVLGSPTTNQVLTYNGTNWVNQDAGGAGLWTAGTGDDIYYNSGVHMVGIGMTDPNAELDVDGDIEYTGTISDMSDRRLKTDIEPLSAGQLANILSLQGVSFKMKGELDDETEFGFIAQDVQPVFPALIYERNEGMLSMNYTGLIAPMVEAIKEQQALIDAQKKQIEALSKRIEALEAEE